MGGTLLFQALTPIAAAVAAALSWQAAFVIFSIPGMILAFLLYRVRISEDRQPESEGKTIADASRDAVGQPSDRLVFLSFAAPRPR
jgi:membrane protein implicated in regulation of membrane protease activity